MLAYIFAGVALGSIYAIATSGLVVTYVSAGVLNFGFGSMAFFLGRFFYFLNTQHGWASFPALIISVFVAGPTLGVLLYFALFRRLALASSLVKIVSTIGLSVALPAAAVLLFGNETITTAPGLAHEPVRIYALFGATATLNQLIAFGSVLTLVVLGTALLQFANVGLHVRAMVDSPALTSLSGINPGAIAGAAWMISTTLAGLAGVLTAPASGLTISGMTGLMAAAFAAVVAGRLHNLAVAVSVAMAMGLVTEVSQKYLPENSSLSSAVITSIPFLVTATFLLAYLATSGRVDDDSEATGGPLDSAIRPQGGRQSGLPARLAAQHGQGVQRRYVLRPLIFTGAIALIPIFASGYWLTLAASGFAFAIIFLSFTIVVGEGGMMWLCQPAFVGFGAIGAAQLATNHGWNPIAAAFGSALLAVPIGLLVGLLTVRLGNLYIALATLSFGLLTETLIFTRSIFYHDGIGVPIERPSFLGDDKYFSYFCLGVLLILAVVVVNLQRSTTGLALAAARSSEPAARTIGLSVLTTKLIAAGLSTFVAALGGALLALDTESATPSVYTTFAGLVWLAVSVSWGVRSVTAAVLAGLALNLLPGLFIAYLPAGLGGLPTLLFGLGAVFVAANPDDSIAALRYRVRAFFDRFATPTYDPADLAGMPTPVEVSGPFHEDYPVR
ncbi:ABC transporter permease [Jatrophihabitans sp. DSM 45814]